MHMKITKIENKSPTEETETEISIVRWTVPVVVAEPLPNPELNELNEYLSQLEKSGRAGDPAIVAELLKDKKLLY